MIMRNAPTGANVSAGTVLFRVVDASQVHVVGQVPEAEARARHARAEIEIAGQPDRVRPVVSHQHWEGAGPHPARCRLPSPSNRTLGIPVGQAVVTC